MDIEDNDSDIEPQHQQHAARLDNNPGQRQRARNDSMEPMDATHIRHPIFTNHNIVQVRLQTLMHEDAHTHHLDYKYIDLQLLRLIVPAPQSTANTYQRKRSGNNNSQTTYSRLFLCKVHSPRHLEDHNQVVYMMEARNMNMYLWNMNTNHRDNGSISIGSIIRVCCPSPVDSFMRGDIPLLVTKVPVFLLKYPSRIDTMQINPQIGSNQSLAFVFNSTPLQVYYTSVVKTQCNGSFCDRQRISDWLGSRGCGCYGMATNSTSLAIQHNISATTFQGDKAMKEFSSQKFSNLYLNGPIPGSCKLYHLQISHAFYAMCDSMKSCINLINQNGGFTVVGWYKRGVISDKSLISQDKNTIGYNSTTEADAQIDSGEICYHIVQIIPSDRDFLDPTTTLGSELSDLKFDVSTIQTIAN